MQGARRLVLLSGHPILFYNRGTNIKNEVLLDSRFFFFFTFPIPDVFLVKYCKLFGEKFVL